MTLEAAQDVFRDSYAKHIGEACEVTPHFESWFASGPYAGELDIERRYHIGLEQVGKYIDWYQSHPEEVIWISEDGTPGIEIGFDIELDGVPVRGFIDAVIDQGEYGIWVRDNKTGNKPGDDFQLGVYAVALAEQYGIEKPMFGDYWMGRTGKPTAVYPLDEWDREAVTAKFRWLEEQIEAGNFPAYPEPSKCRFCDVSASCIYRA
jgi:putative RecB family exonuclease